MNSESSSRLRVATAVIEQQGRVLITQRQSDAALGGLWEFPSVVVSGDETDETALRRELRDRLGIDVELGGSKARRTHQFDKRSVDFVLYRGTLPKASSPSPHQVADLRWVAPEDLEAYPFPSSGQTAAYLFSRRVEGN